MVIRSSLLLGMTGCAILTVGNAFVKPLAPNMPPQLATLARRPALVQSSTSLVQRGVSSGRTVLRAEGPEGGADTVGTDVPFELRGFSLATIGLGLGGVITVGSFAEYLLSSGSEGLSGVGFVYGIPILLIGLALKYAQLDPVPVETTPEADRLFAQKATPTILKIKKDVTRHRYGDDAHLDTTVQALGLVIPNKEFPQLQYIKQGVEDGELTFSMIFRSDETPYRMWAEADRLARYEKFFGPGVRARVEKVDAAKRLVAITLLTGEKKAEEQPVAKATDAEAKQPVNADF